MNNKKSVYVWIILVLFILGITGTLWSLVSGLININVLLTPGLLSNPTANIIRLGLYLVDICLSLIFVYKLYNFKQDVIKWTHISFAYIIAYLFLQVILTPNLLFAILAFIPWIVLSIITIIIWVTFVKHLKKLIINNINISENLDNATQNIENGEKVGKIASFKLWIKNNKKLVIILSIIIFITVVVPLVMIFGVKIISKVQCGKEGALVGNSRDGYSCFYQKIVTQEYKDRSQCFDSKQFCESKGKTDKEASCIPGGIDLTNRIKIDENGNFYIEEDQGPVTCSYCCGVSTVKNNSVNNENKSISDKYDPNGPIPSPIVDSVNMINARGEVVDKFVKGTFRIADTGEIFDYTEKYNIDRGHMTNSTIRECIEANCSFVYFTKDTRRDNGDRIIFLTEDDTHSVGNTDDLIKTQLISYQYFMIPDTGEVFPVVER